MQQAIVRVPLTVEQRAGKADEMARLIARIVGIETEAKDSAAKFREEIKGLETELRVLAQDVIDGAEARSQMDLMFTQAEAAKALAGVGAAACTCDSPDAPVKSIDCPVHGVETRGENAAVDEQGPNPSVEDAELGPRTVEHVDEILTTEAAADFVVPEDVAVEMLARDLEAAGVVPKVETTAPETPPVVDEFIAAQKSRRRRRAEA